MLIRAGGGHRIRRSKKNKRTCNDDRETAESLNPGDIHQDSIQDVWSELSEEVASNLSESVVSVAILCGSSVLFACSGIAIECQGCVTRFLTSASLVRALNDKTKHPANLKVEVRYEGSVVTGFLGKYDLDYGLAIVNVTSCLDVHAVRLTHVVDMEFLPCTKVVALGRGISGKLVATGGILTRDSRESEDSEELMLSTCKICEGWEGDPLFNTEGNLVGMNLFFVKERTVFLPTSIIFERLEHFRIFLRSEFLERLQNLKACSTGETLVLENSGADLTRCLKKNKRTDDVTSLNIKRTDLARSLEKKRTCSSGGKTTKSLISGNSDVLIDDPFEDLDFSGHPKPPIDMSDGMILVNTFEDTFGDKYGSGVWSELSETVSCNISQNVVALASCYGKKGFLHARFFY
ncbi:putative protease Do-like 14 isoform X2 [Miscanthus floridulus]